MRVFLILGLIAGIGIESEGASPAVIKNTIYFSHLVWVFLHIDMGTRGEYDY